MLQNRYVEELKDLRHTRNEEVSVAVCEKKISFRK